MTSNMLVREITRIGVVSVLYIFLDESGDLGFDLSKSGTSRYFVITLLVCEDLQTQNGIISAVKRTLKNKLNHKKNSSRKVQELKGTQTTLPIKKYFFRQLPSTGLKIYSVVLNKNRVYGDLRLPAAKKKLYNYLARLVLEKVGIPDHTSQISLVVDRCKNQAEIKDFNQYLENELRHRIPKEAVLRIDHQSSHESKGLQAVDLFCWGIARKHEMADTAWYAIYKGWISYEKVFLPEK